MISDVEVKNIFDSNEIPENAYKRISSNHLLDFYLGFNNINDPSLLFIHSDKPMNILNSKVISINIGKRTDDNYALTFSLKDINYLDLFCLFCSDIINSTIGLKYEDNLMDFVCQRYILWQQMLQKVNNHCLTEKEIKGLIGELFFLKQYLAPQHGYEKSINAWIGPEKGNQDFVFTDSWFEIKSTSSSGKEIMISSVEQLDINTKGYLVVIFFDKTSSNATEVLTLNKLIEEIKEEIDMKLKSTFEVALLSIGYKYSEEYDKYRYRFRKCNVYQVDDTFPCLRRDDIPKSIGKVKYELVLNSIEKWRIDYDFARI